MIIDNLGTALSSDVYVAIDDDTTGPALCNLLNSAGFRVKVFRSAGEFLRMAASLRPGSLVVQLPPESDGADLLDHLRALQHQFPTVLVTNESDVKSAVRAMKSGAVDFLDRPGADELVSAVHAAQRRVAELVQEHNSKDAAARVTSLSVREYEILERLVAGMPNKAIAKDLAISPRTVEFHRAHIMAKMGAANLAELVHLGLAAGLEIKLRPARNDRLG